MVVKPRLTYIYSGRREREGGGGIVNEVESCAWTHLCVLGQGSRVCGAVKWVDLYVP